MMKILEAGGSVKSTSPVVSQNKPYVESPSKKTPRKAGFHFLDWSIG
mgnify:CR=1 FL=1|jgi:hypothetical protein